MADDARARGLGGCEGGGSNRVEVADHDVHVQPERPRALETAVCRDDRSRGGHDDRRPRPGCDNHDVRFSHVRSSAGITQIRFCGSAAR